MKKLQFLIGALLLGSLMLGNSTGMMAAQKDDISGHHLEEEMRYLIDEEILRGDGSGYHPENKISRGQFAALLSRTLDLPAPQNPVEFTDVNEKTGVKPEIQKAAAAELITGIDGRFMPYQPVTRQHIAVMTARALRFLDLPQGEAPDADFRDTDLILAVYRPDVNLNVHFGLINGSIGKDGRYFRPNDTATRAEASAILARLHQTMKETKKAADYHVADLSTDGSTSLKDRYKTFNEAVAAAGEGQVVLQGDRIVWMKSGIVVTKASEKSVTTEIYSKIDQSGDKTKFLDPFTYVNVGTELEYIRAGKDFVEIRISGKNGFISQDHAILKPWSQVNGRSYFTKTESGELSHTIYNHISGTYSPSYIIGRAPSGMTEGTRYYSWDQIHFGNSLTYNGSNSEAVAIHYPYFQYLSARTKTDYTAEEIDAYVMKQLAELEKKNTTTYKDVTKTSRLIGIGKAVKKAEQEKGVHALMILALAQHESAYGTSQQAQKYNNLFGIYVRDNNSPDHDYIQYSSIEENINKLLDSFLNANYLPPTGKYANGASFGTKANGMNVKYASDPFWGSKAAGHMYRIDKAMGGKEFGKHTIGIVNTSGTNARTEPVIPSGDYYGNVPYSYRLAGMPVTVLKTVQKPGRNWLEVISDQAAEKQVYLAEELVDIVHRSSK